MDNRELLEAVEEYEMAKAAEKAAVERRQDAQDLVATMLEAEGRKSMTLDYGDGHKVKVTRSSSDYVKSVDEKGLKKALGAKTWKLVTEVRFSATKLKAAILAGEVDQVLAAKYVETGIKKPSIFVTEIKADEEDE